MLKRQFLKGSAITTLLSLLPFNVRAKPTIGKPMNLLFLTADDMDWSLPGFMGGKGNLTPNLDKLSERAHRFINNRSAAPICQPSREAMMTGITPHRSGGIGFTPIRDGIPTLTTVLQDNGYFAAAIHKLNHMQPKSCFPWDFSVPGKDRNPLIYEKGMRDAIAAAQKAGKPFFINCNMNDPHRPFYGSSAADYMDHKQTGPYKIPREIQPQEVTVPPFLEDLPPIRQELAQYWNSTQRLDITIGKILNVLEESGQADNTLILFSSDHGMPFPFSKATCYDSGTRTPVLLSWPEMGTPRTFDDLTLNVDLLPTLLDILNVNAPRDIDGHSWLPRIRGAAFRQREYVITEVNTVANGMSYPQRAIQNMRYSLMFAPWSDGSLELDVDAMNGLTYNAMCDAAAKNASIAGRVKQFLLGIPVAFYDLASDPGQRHNLVHAPVHKPKIDEMTIALLQYMKDTKDPQLTNIEALLAGKKPAVPQNPAEYYLRPEE